MPRKKTTPPVEPVEPAPEPLAEVTPPEPPAPVVEAPAPVVQAAPIPPQPLSPGDARTWAMVSHLSVLLNLITGFGGPIAALIIYLVYKDRSRYVAYHSLQAMIFQLIWWFGSGVLIGLMWAIVGALSAILIGIILIPFALVFTFLFLILPLGALIYGIVGAVQTSQGEDFQYWLVGDWTRGTLTG